MNKLLWFVVGAAAGAGMTYAMDPDMGRTRRTKAMDQVKSGANSATDSVNRSLDRATDRITGTIAGALPESQPDNEQTLLDKVRSEVLGGAEWRELDVHADAANGVVTLRGQVHRTEQRDDLGKAVSKVTGVQEVVNLLHLPGEPAPNVSAARSASAPGF